MSGQKWLLFLVRYGLALVYGLLVLVRTLFGILLRPRSSFARVARPIPPAVLDDPTLGQHHFVTLKERGIKLHYVSNGSPESPLMLFVHGFPEVGAGEEEEEEEEEEAVGRRRTVRDKQKLVQSQSCALAACSCEGQLLRTSYFHFVIIVLSFCLLILLLSFGIHGVTKCANFPRITTSSP